MQNDNQVIKPACAEVNRPYPIEVVCDACGAELEIWSDEEAPRCVGCGAPLKVGQEG